MSDIEEKKWIEEISNKVVAHITAIMEENVKEQEYEDLFALGMGIGKGKEEFERGCKMLSRWEYNWLDYEQAVKRLAKWCEV